MPTGSTRGSSRTPCARSRRMIQDNGIDEIYIDLTDVQLPEPIGASFANRNAIRGRAPAKSRQSIKDAVRAATGLTCSIGVAPNKLLAKMASELDKPDGLTMLRAEDVERRHLAASRAAGSTASDRSPARSSKRSASARSASSPRPILPGSSSTSAARTARGCTTRRTVATSGPWSRRCEPKSISRETTFERDLSAQRDRERAVGDLHRAVRRRERRISNARAMSARRSDSSCATTTSGR